MDLWHGWSPRLLLNRVLARLWEDGCADLAAQMSFYFVLSLVPFFLVLAALVGWLLSTTFWQALVQWVTAYFPQGSRKMLFSIFFDLTYGYSKFMSIGLLSLIWSASSGFVTLMEALSIAHGAKETRSFWRKRIVAIAATVGAAVFFLLSFALTSVGHDVATALSYQHRYPRVTDAKIFWDVGRWTANFLLIMLAINLVNYFLPSGKRSWNWLSPGTSFVALTFVLASFGFDYYIQHSSIIPRVYGALAGVIIFMIWIYMSSLILLIGAETDTAIKELTQQRAFA